MSLRRRRLVVGAVADRIVHHYYAWPGTLTVGDAQQCIDRATRSVDLDRRHVVNLRNQDGSSARSLYMAMRLFVLYAVIELAVIVALTSTIGFGWTVLALLGTFVLGPGAGRITGQAPHSPAPVRPDRVHGARSGDRQRARRTRYRSRRDPRLGQLRFGCPVAAAAHPCRRPPAGHRDGRAKNAAGHRGRRYRCGYRLGI